MEGFEPFRQPQPQPEKVEQPKPIEQPKTTKTKEDKYKSALRLAIGVIVLLAILLAVTAITSRASTSYRAGYVDGWNGCREKQIELINEQKGLEDVVIIPTEPTLEPNLTSNLTDLNEQDAQIQIVVE